jgi:putative ABC transport system permease protein
MNLPEDITLSVRAMLGSSLETLLLVIGLALSIGATAAGIAMYEQALREGESILQSAEYREIVITARESGDSMSSAVTQQSTEEVSLSLTDLAASETAPSVAYAYIASGTRLRFNNAVSSLIHEEPQAPEPDTQLTAPPEGAPTELDASPMPERPVMASVEDGPVPLLEEVSALSVSQDYFSALGLSVKQGSVFTEQDLLNNSKVLVVGSEIAKTLFEDGIVMNRQVASFDSIYTIIGVLAETGDVYDTRAFVPSALLSGSVGAQAQQGPRRAVELHFSVSDASKLDAAESQLAAWFDATYDGASVNIQIPRESAQAAIDRTEKVAVITLVLALAGLLIASVNVSNILYGRTLRRRKQIGILKALGASSRQIFRLFFNESLFMIAIGSVLGLGIVFAFSSLIVSVTNGTSLSVLAVLVGVIAATLVTLGFTLIPAIQATKVPAAEAIRVD